MALTTCLCLREYSKHDNNTRQDYVQNLAIRYNKSARDIMMVMVMNIRHNDNNEDVADDKMMMVIVMVMIAS